MKNLAFVKIAAFPYCLFLIALISLCMSASTTANTSNLVKDRIKIAKKVRLQVSAPDDSEDYTAGKMAVLEKKRYNLILDIKRFLREARDSNQKAELNLRLGGLYLEDYYAKLAQAQKVFDQKSQEYEALDKKKKGSAPKLDNSEALASLARARTIYRDLATRYPNHPRRDEMLYFLALTSLDSGQTQAAMDQFQRLAQDFPNSKYVNEALVQLGDHYFDSNSFAKAESYYDRLIAKKHRPLLLYATYKKAWCEYNTQRPTPALQHFKYVIMGENDLQTQVRVKQEALRDITLPFVDLRMVNEAVAFFESIGGAAYRDGIATMATLYFEKVQYKQAIQLYDLLISMDRNYFKNPSYEVSIVDAYMLGDNRKAGIERLFGQLPNYLENSTWYELNAQNPKVVAEAERQFEETARKYALQIHAEAQKTRNDQLYNVAKDLYANYIRFFPKSIHAPKIRFYLAEILYKNGDYVNAASHYYQVYLAPSAGELRLDGIRNALTALDQQINSDRKKQGLSGISSKSSTKLTAKVEDKLTFIAYSDTETSFLKISKEYLRQFRGQKDAADVLYERAYLRYVHHELANAYRSFWVLVQWFPEHETALSSAYLILDILNRKQDYPKLITACKKFLETKAFKKDSFRKEVADILRRAELKRIQLVEEKGQYREAADNYIEYTKAYGPQDESLFEKALYNASVNYTKAELLLTAVETQEKFLRRFPKSKLTENLYLQVATTHQQLANFDKAAVYFEKFARSYPNNAQAKSALRLAGLFYWGSGSARKAEAIMKSYLDEYPSERKTAEKDLLGLYESEGAVERQFNFYRVARAQKGIPISFYVSYTVKMAEIQGQKTGKVSPALMEEALKISEKHGKLIKETPAGVEAMAKAYFWYTSRKDEYFRNLKLALPQRQLEARLQKKLAMLKELEAEYGKIATLGSGEWGLAAIYKTASAYRHMAQNVLAAPVPSELTGEQLEIYRQELSKQMIVPFNEKALSLAEQCLDKAQELNLLSSWTSKCYSLAGQMKSDRYPLARTFHVPPMATALILPPATSKVHAGNVKQYAYPFYSIGMFKPENAAGQEAAPTLPELYSSSKSFDDDSDDVLPKSLSYSILMGERVRILKSATQTEQPANSQEVSFAYLNLLRLLTPKKAIPVILTQISKDPKNIALHNLLALAYLESDNSPAARVTWLSLTAQGTKHAAIWNNLGILSYLEGNETAAIGYYQEALQAAPIKESLINLGFIALKYRNGFEAKKHFTKALELEPNDVPGQVGLAVAQIQNRQWSNGKDALLELTKQYASDPYARLSLSYYFIDVEKQNQLAKRLLQDYMEEQSAQEDLLFRKAYQEARQVASSDGDLPDIE